jgi:hypothetical protein
MPNTILTPVEITRESLRILHQKANFLGNINKQYDNRFANDGAKIGDSLKIRLPNEYTVRTGMNMVTQDTVETSTTLQVSTVKGVDLNFSSLDLTLSLDDFSKRIIEPAMTVLAANIEADALTMYQDVYNISDEDTVAASLKSYLLGRQILNDNLTPSGDRSAIISTDHSVKLVDALKGLFHDSSAIKEQYKEGMMGRTAGFDFYENTLLNAHQTGTSIKATGYVTTAAVIANGSTTVPVGTGTTTFKKGDVVTFSACFRVHPETKVSTSKLQSFVVTADYAGGAGNLQVSPPIYTTTGKQNVSPTGIASGATVVKVGAAASETLTPSMVFNKDAFTFATADLLLPKGRDFASRQVMDGISMSIVRDFTIADRSFPCRIDVLYGYKAVRPQWACRIHADG